MSIKLTFVGDIMSEKVQNELAYINADEYNYSNMFDKEVIKFFGNSDYVIGNLETPIAGKELGYSCQIYSYNTPEDFLLTLKNIGINCVSTANNHCLDRGVEGLMNTIKALERNKIDYFGTYKKKDSNRIFIKDINGIKIAFLSYTYGTNATFNKQYLKSNEKYMVNLFREQEQNIKKWDFYRRFKRKMEFLDVRNCKITNYRYLHKLKKDISEAKKRSDFVIMNMHSRWAIQ